MPGLETFSNGSEMLITLPFDKPILASDPPRVFSPNKPNDKSKTAHSSDIISLPPISLSNCAPQVYFLFSQSDLGLQLNTLATNIIASYVHAGPSTDARKYGILSDTCMDEVAVGDVQDSSQLLHRLSTFQTFRLPPLVWRLARLRHYTHAKDDVHRAAVLFTGPAVMASRDIFGLNKGAKLLLNAGLQVSYQPVLFLGPAIMASRDIFGLNKGAKLLVDAGLKVINVQLGNTGYPLVEGVPTIRANTSSPDNVALQIKARLCLQLSASN
ncbi:martilin [Elysia marginata]|uniref:Martilin n=1 Tax=Elysia marginata TaxID=1093978 RepID=A0AAV4EYS7_9GAST|nr:martilin [Elysia marginata]